jgi:Zn-dependent protease
MSGVDMERKDERRPPAGKGAGVAAAAGGALLFKGKGLLVLLKSLSLGKFLFSGLSMFTMIAFEASRGGWLFGVGFVGLILIHELGHGFAIRQAGLAAGFPIFIPFFGAMISLQGQPQSQEVEAEIAYGGPLAGTAASLAMAALGLATGSRLALSLAAIGFQLNLFNLIPISPLDGGRVAQVFSKQAWVLGGVLIVGMTLLNPSPQMMIIALFSLSRAFQGPQAMSTVEASPAARRDWAWRYFGLCAVLALGSHFAHDLLVR